MASTLRRFLLIPLPVAALCAFSNMAAIPAASLPPYFSRWWLIAVPAFVVFQILTIPEEFFTLGVGTEERIDTVVLAFSFLLWSALVLLPFWRPFRLRSLSLFATRIIFVLAGALLAILTWYLYYAGYQGTDI